jgi:hypothetical protein
MAVDENAREAPRVEVEGPRCPYCHESIGADDGKTACEACMAWHHRGCWQEHGACSACGRTASATAPIVVAAPRDRRPSARSAAVESRRGERAVSRSETLDPPAPCIRLRCAAEAEPGHPLCARHRMQDAWVGLAAGLVALAMGAVFLAIDVELRWVGAAMAGLGALNLGLSLKAHSDRWWTRRRAVRPAAPSKPGS